MDANEEEST